MGKSVKNTKRKWLDKEKLLKDVKVCCNGGHEVRGYASQVIVLHKSSQDIGQVNRSKASAIRTTDEYQICLRFWAAVQRLQGSTCVGRQVGLLGTIRLLEQGWQVEILHVGGAQRRLPRRLPGRHRQRQGGLHRLRPHSQPTLQRYHTEKMGTQQRLEDSDGLSKNNYLDHEQ